MTSKNVWLEDNTLTENCVYGAEMSPSKDDWWRCFEAGMMMFTDDIFPEGRTVFKETAREPL